jgi:hypothetical protein
VVVVVSVDPGYVGWLLARNRARETSAEAPSADAGPLPARCSPRARSSEPQTATSRDVAKHDHPATDTPSVNPPTNPLQISKFKIGTAVVDRRLVGRADRLPEESRVVFWTEVLKGRPGHVIRHVWLHEGRAVMKANLAIRGPHWRTHSTLILPRGSAGRWTVEARTSDGRLLARNDFVCEPLEARRPESTNE